MKNKQELGEERQGLDISKDFLVFGYFLEKKYAAKDAKEYKEWLTKLPQTRYYT